jgi:hypothetical protein
MNWIPQGIVPEVVFTTNDAAGVDAADAGRMTRTKKKNKKHNPAESVLMVFHPRTVELRYIRVKWQ